MYSTLRRVITSGRNLRPTALLRACVQQLLRAVEFGASLSVLPTENNADTGHVLLAGRSPVSLPEPNCAFRHTEQSREVSRRESCGFAKRLEPVWVESRHAP